LAGIFFWRLEEKEDEFVTFFLEIRISFIGHFVEGIGQVLGESFCEVDGDQNNDDFIRTPFC
jgi:hypothetical protein